MVRNALVPDGRGSVRAVPTDVTEVIPAGLVFRSVGYRGVPIEGVPFDERRGTIPHADGRVLDTAGVAVPGVYVCGWIKRGPSGVIGTNKSCAADTVAALLEDVSAGRIPGAAGAPEPLDEMLGDRGIAVVGWTYWQTIDRAEVERGTPAGRPREKITSVTEMLDIVRSARPAS